jgi:phosphatidylserine decarboxylase
MFHKEGQTIILVTFFVTVAIILSSQFYIEIDWLRILLQITALIILVLILQFFRNPKRLVTPNFDEIIAPVDGKVICNRRGRGNRIL